MPHTTVLISMLGCANSRPVSYELAWNPDAETETPDTYHQVALQRALNPDQTWLLGSSEAKDQHADDLSYTQPFIKIRANPTEVDFPAIHERIAERIEAELAYPWGTIGVHLDLSGYVASLQTFLLAMMQSLCRIEPRVRIEGIYHCFPAAEGRRARIELEDPDVELSDYALARSRDVDAPESLVDGVFPAHLLNLMIADVIVDPLVALLRMAQREERE